MEKRQPKIAVNVYVIKDDKILLGKRKNVAGDGDWGLPGGHLEFMESLIEGSARELEEETGLRANKLTFLNFINDPRTEDSTHYLHVNFQAEDVVGEPELKEPDKCYEWKWFDIDNLPENIFIGHRRCIPAYSKGISFNDYSAE